MSAAPGASLRSCRLLGAAALTLFVVLAFTPAANLVAAWFEMPPEVEPAEAIVVLGGGGAGLDDGLPTNRSLRRAVEGILLYRDGLAPLLVFSGSRAEIESRVRMAVRLGVPPTALVRLPGSRTTRDEALRLQAFAAHTGVRKILLVTDAPHMLRARRLFAQGGFDALPVPVGGTLRAEPSPEARLSLVRDLFQELLARLYYRVAGYF
jgi:uncharacterized SAM-binding protein YcdF (DUF218 family)